MSEETKAEPATNSLGNLSVGRRRNGRNGRGHQEGRAPEKAVLPEGSPSPGNPRVTDDARPTIKGNLIGPLGVLPFGRGIVRDRDFVSRGKIGNSPDRGTVEAAPPTAHNLPSGSSSVRASPARTGPPATGRDRPGSDRRI